MTDTRGLDNLIWVYSPDANRDFKTDFYPGSSYVDIVGLDAYFSDDFTIQGYDELTALNKPFAFTEIGTQNKMVIWIMLCFLIQSNKNIRKPCTF